MHGILSFPLHNLHSFDVHSSSFFDLNIYLIYNDYIHLGSPIQNMTFLLCIFSPSHSLLLLTKIFYVSFLVNTVNTHFSFFLYFSASLHFFSLIFYNILLILLIPRVSFSSFSTLSCIFCTYIQHGPVHAIGTLKLLKKSNYFFLISSRISFAMLNIFSINSTSFTI